jgi:steroid delta-isomerase-like uncharacterized protein
MKNLVRVSLPIIILMSSVYSSNAWNSPTHASSVATDDKHAIERLFAAWNSRDADKVAACFTEDAVYEDVAAGQINRGRTEIRKWAAGAFADIADFKIEVTGRSVNNGRGMVEWLWSGTDKGLFKTGKVFSVRGVSIIEVQRGKISNYKEYYDFSTVMRQLGAMPNAERQ